MLRIKREQMNALEAVAMKHFEDEMLERMAVFAPRLYEIYGEKIFREVIRQGIQRAKAHRFTMRGPVQFYIETMFTLGCDFDSDPQYPWCREILEDVEVQDELVRADHLFDMMNDYLDAAVGVDSQYVVIALKRLNSIGPNILNMLTADIKGSLLAGLEEFYPEKTQMVGKKSLSRLIEEGFAVAKKHGIDSKKGSALISILMFMFGHGVIDDPLYPWIKNTLEDPSILDQESRVDKLAFKTRTYASAVLEYLS